MVAGQLAAELLGAAPGVAGGADGLVGLLGVLGLLRVGRGAVGEVLAAVGGLDRPVRAAVMAVSDSVVLSVRM